MDARGKVIEFEATLAKFSKAGGKPGQVVLEVGNAHAAAILGMVGGKVTATLEGYQTVIEDDPKAVDGQTTLEDEIPEFGATVTAEENGVIAEIVPDDGDHYADALQDLHREGSPAEGEGIVAEPEHVAEQAAENAEATALLEAAAGMTIVDEFADAPTPAQTAAMEDPAEATGHLQVTDCSVMWDALKRAGTHELEAGGIKYTATLAGTHLLFSVHGGATDDAERDAKKFGIIAGAKLKYSSGGDKKPHTFKGEIVPVYPATPDEAFSMPADEIALEDISMVQDGSAADAPLIALEED